MHVFDSVNRPACFVTVVILIATVSLSGVIGLVCRSRRNLGSSFNVGKHYKRMVFPVVVWDSVGIFSNSLTDI